MPKVPSIKHNNRVDRFVYAEMPPIRCKDTSFTLKMYYISTFFDNF